MPARKRTSAPAGTVSVTVVPPFAVYHDGDQRTGTLDAVPTDVAQHWAKHGYVTINEAVVDDQPTDTK